MAFVKLNLKRIWVYPGYLVTGFMVPILLVCFYGFLITDDAGNSIYLANNFMEVYVIVVCSTTIAQLTMNYCSDRIEKRLKHYSIIKGATKQYIIGETSLSYIYIMLSLFINLILIRFAFNINVDFVFVITAILFISIMFVIGVMISFIIGSLLNSNSMCLFVSVIIYFIILFSSNGFLPIAFMKENAHFFQMLTPIGALNFIFKYITVDNSLQNWILIMAILLFIFWTSLYVYLGYRFIKLY